MDLSLNKATKEELQIKATSLHTDLAELAKCAVSKSLTEWVRTVYVFHYSIS